MTQNRLRLRFLRKEPWLRRAPNRATTTFGPSDQVDTFVYAINDKGASCGFYNDASIDLP